MGAVTNRLIEFIKALENPNRVGFQSDGTVKSYWDSNGYAIGYGLRYLSNGAVVSKTTVLTEGEVEILLIDKLNDFARIATQFRRWVLVNGQPSTYLRTRREKEIALYTGGAIGGGLFIVVVLIGLYLLKKKRII